ncbi:MAG: type II toxin-antitoxin system VapC family toxin [Pseudomonadota bacterium]
MIGIDTNVLVRFLTQDDPQQSELARRFFTQELSAKAPGFIGLIVLAETVWVLQRADKVSAAEILELVADLLQSPDIVIEERDVVSRALATARRESCGLTDALVAASAAASGCQKIVSFDRAAVGAGMTLLS